MISGIDVAEAGRGEPGPSFMIGVILAAVSIFLAYESRHLLIGQASESRLRRFAARA